MPKRDWSAITAVGIIAVVCLGFTIGLWSGAGNRDHRVSDDTQPFEQRSSLDADTFWQEHAGSAESYQTLCDSPVDRSQADLCQQWRSANAAEQSAKDANWSLILSVIGVLGLLLTIYLSNKATSAATDATRAAIEANKIAALDRRAWVGITGLERPEKVTLLNDGSMRVAISLKLHNFGDTPALNIAHIIEFKHVWGGYSPVQLMRDFANDARFNFGTETILPHTSHETIRNMVSYGIAALRADVPTNKATGASLFVMTGVAYNIVGDTQRHFALRAYPFMSPAFLDHERGKEVDFVVMETGSFTPELMT